MFYFEVPVLPFMEKGVAAGLWGSCGWLVFDAVVF